MKKNLYLLSILLYFPIFVSLSHAQNVWTAVGSDFNNYVRALEVHKGVLYAAGEFTSNQGTTTEHVAYWDGNQWQKPGISLTNYTYILESDGDKLWAGGWFSHLNHRGVACWNDTSWADPLTTGFFNPEAIGFYHEYIVVAEEDDISVNSDTSFQRLFGSFLHRYGAIIEYQGDLILGGLFQRMSTDSVNNIGRWDGTDWHQLGGGLNGFVEDLIIFQGDLYAAGAFDSSGTGTPIQGVARWDGSQWQPLGTGLSNSANIAHVNNLAAYNNELYVYGEFNTAGSVSAFDMAKWNGNQWQAVTPGLSAPTFYDFTIDTLTGIAYGATRTAVDYWVYQLDLNTVGIEESIPAGQEVILYPNPASESCKVKISLPPTSPWKVEVLDALGRMVIESPRSMQPYIDLDLKSLPAGIYFYRVHQTESSFQTGKLIIR